MRLDFSEAYLKLNPDQKLAVDAIDGPVMVIAGPGTGKTQLLSLRVANILKLTDCLPENILCLTFTDSAVNEMRSRLVDIIGQAAYNVTVSTYHSFGSDLIRAYPAYFSNDVALTPLSELSANSILRQIQSNLTYKNPFKDGLYLSDLNQLIGEFKQALISPEDLRLIVLSNLDFIEKASPKTRAISQKLTKVSKKSIDDFASLIIENKPKPSPNNETLAQAWDRELRAAIDEANLSGKTSSLSRWKLKFLSKDKDANFIAAGKEQNERLLHFCQIYELYLADLKEQGVYDFDDMILNSIDALHKHPEFRYSLQEKYLYILLDEFQDTNQAQAKLVSLLADNPVNEGKPNIMAVGDDDQAIYAFQGAKYSHMLDFISDYKDVKLVTLKQNYRSTPAIIELSSQVATQIDSRLTTYLNGIDKDFVSANKQLSNQDKIRRLVFSNQADEYAWIANDIKRLAAKKSNIDIAVLAPKHKYLEAIVSYLQANDLALSYERRENILEDPIIDELITFAKLVVAINSGGQQLTDSLLAQVLNFDFWELPTDKIWQISWQAYQKRQPWMKLILDQKETRLIGLFLLKLASNASSLKFEYLLDQILGMSEVTIFDKQQLIFRSRFYEYYNSTGPEPKKVISEIFSALSVLREQFKSYRTQTTNPLLLVDFVDFIYQAVSSKVKILNQSSYIEANTAVNLMTAYKAKGQEFKTVYLISASDEVWGPKARIGHSRISLPPNLEYITYRTKDVDERLRLLYVAMTRAKQQLVITSYDQSDLAKPTTLLKFLEEYKEQDKLYSPLLPKKYSSIEQHGGQPSKPAQPILNWQQGHKRLELRADLKDLLRPRLEKYQLSPTELNSFIDVRNAGPQNFYNRTILKYPSPVGPAVDYGSSIHESLDWLQKQLITTKKLASIKDLVNEFTKRLKIRRLNEADHKQLLERGSQCLKLYYAVNKRSFSPNDSSEFNFKNEAVFVGDAYLNGNIDKLVIDKANKKLSIVDYKTGKSYKRWGYEAKLHLYSNQLYFYKLLVENSSSFKNFVVEQAYLDFVEADSSGDLNKLYIEFNDEQLKRTKQLIEAVWRHIQELNFPDVSNYSADVKGIRKFEDDLIEAKI